MMQIDQVRGCGFRLHTAGYTLTYDPQQDQLRGIYFQAVEQQNFNVFFIRMK